MKSLNVQIGAELYEALRSIAFINKEPMAVLVRKFLQEQIQAQPKAVKKKMVLVLEAIDEDKVEKALRETESMSEAEFDREFGFDKKDFS